MEYLASIKWKDGHQCAKCGHKKCFGGKRPFGRCRTKCHYDGFPTAHVPFHKVKFPMQKAFYTAFLTAVGKKGISTYQLGRKPGLRQKTCWLSGRKAVGAVKDDGGSLLSGSVEMDEFYVGGPDAGKKGRGRKKKKQGLLAIEASKFGVHRCRTREIPSTGPVGLLAFADKIIGSSGAHQDGRIGYAPLNFTLNHY